MHGNEITISLDVDEARRIVRELRDLDDVMKNVPLCLERLKRQIRDQLPPSSSKGSAYGI
jgi:hypothetical protein